MRYFNLFEIRRWIVGLSSNAFPGSWEILQNFAEDALPVQPACENPFNILHDKNRWSVNSDNAKVLLVQEMPWILSNCSGLDPRIGDLPTVE